MLFCVPRTYMRVRERVKADKDKVSVAKGPVDVGATC